MSVHLAVRPSVYLSACPPVCLSACLPVCLCLSVSVYVSESLCLRAVLRRLAFQCFSTRRAHEPSLLKAICARQITLINGFNSSPGHH